MRGRALRDAIEAWLEAERDQLILWMPVMLGLGIALWFVLPDVARWVTAMLLCGAVAAGALAVGQGGRAARIVAIGALAVLVGMALVWWRAERVAGVVLTRPMIVAFEARVVSVEPLVARGLVRLRLVPGKVVDPVTDRAGHPIVLPGALRLNLAEADVPAGLTSGATIGLRARLMPPPEPAVPGAYDYARTAWFDGIGATGRGFAPVTVITAGEAAGSELRVRLSRHIQSQVAGSAGGIASALATGDQGAIAESDAEAMRRSGLAHLLSVSGLHITAAVALVMLVVMRTLALSPWLALHVRLPLIAAAAGAAAAVGYTLLTSSVRVIKQ